MNEILKYIIFFLLGIIVYYFLFNNPNLGARKLIEGFITDVTIYETVDEDGNITSPTKILSQIFLKTQKIDGGRQRNSENNPITSVDPVGVISVNDMFSTPSEGLTFTKDNLTIDPKESIYFNRSGYYTGIPVSASTAITTIGPTAGQLGSTQVHPDDIKNLMIKATIPQNINISYLKSGENDIVQNIDFPAIADDGQLDIQSTVTDAEADAFGDISSNIVDTTNTIFYKSTNNDNMLLIEFIAAPRSTGERNITSEQINVYFKINMPSISEKSSTSQEDPAAAAATISNLEGYDSNEDNDTKIMRIILTSVEGDSSVIGHLQLNNLNDLTKNRRILIKTTQTTGIKNYINLLLNTTNYEEGNIIVTTDNNILAQSSDAGENDIIINQNILKVDLFFYTYLEDYLQGGSMVGEGDGASEVESLKFAELLNVIFLGTGQGGRFSSLTGCGENARTICEEIRNENANDGSHWIPKTDPSKLDENCIPTKSGELRALTGGGTCYENPNLCCKDISCSTVFFARGGTCGNRLSLPSAKCELEDLEPDQEYSVDQCSDACCGTQITNISRDIFNDILLFSRKIDPEQVSGINTIKLKHIHYYIINSIINIQTTFTSANVGTLTLNLEEKSVMDTPTEPNALTINDFQNIDTYFHGLVTDGASGSGKLINIPNNTLEKIKLKNSDDFSGTSMLEGLFSTAFVPATSGEDGTETARQEGGIGLDTKFQGVDGTEQIRDIKSRYKNFFDVYIGGGPSGETDSQPSALHVGDGYNLQKNLKENVILLSHTFSDSLNTFEGGGDDVNVINKYSGIMDNDAPLSLSRFQLLL
tara:strand:+ start:1632 stop:4094 length:2463 start_codon:yes stop_codon:yes gene_type:complete